MKNEEVKKVLFMCLLTVFFCVVLFQMANVFLYHDDYGYFTLTYHNPHALGTGHNKSIKQMLRFLGTHYMIHGGRVLYFFIELLLGCRSLWPLRIVQALVISGIVGYSAWQTDKKVFGILTAASLYFAQSLTIARDGIYWFTASILYIFPLVPFLVACTMFWDFLAFRKGSPYPLKKYILMNICLFFASFSQEQTSCALLFFVFGAMFVRFVLDEGIGVYPDIKKRLIISVCIAAAGFILLMAAPGNWARASNDGRGLAQLLIENAGQVMLYLYLGDAKVLHMAELSICIAAAVFLYRKKAAKIGFTVFSAGFSLILAGMCTIRHMGCYNSLSTFLNYDYTVVRAVLGCHFLTVCIQVTLFYTAFKKDIRKLLIFCSGVVTLAFMFIAPASVPGRATIPFYFILIFILTDMACTLFSEFKTYKLPALWCLLVFVYAAANYSGILEGYVLNANIHRANDILLKRAEQQIADGGTVKTVTLYKNIDEDYSIPGAYNERYVYIAEWMKTYYNLPQDVEFEFKDYYEQQ